MRLILATLLLTVVLVSGCQTQIIYVVLSPTPSPEEGTEAVIETTQEVSVLPTETLPVEATAEVTAGVQAATVVAVVPTVAVTPLDIGLTGTIPPTETPAPQTPSVTPVPTNYPAPLLRQIQVAEQLFENGRIFWLEPNQQLWVLVVTGEGRGTWSVYEDTFVEGEPESDPSLVPPEGLLQPVRGFGKLWREVEELREQLGWATTPEFGYVSRYEFHAGGTTDAQGNFTQVPGTGYHILFSLYGEQFRFNEADSTWQLGG